MNNTGHCEMALLGRFWFSRTTPHLIPKMLFSVWDTLTCRILWGYLQCGQ